MSLEKGGIECQRRIAVAQRRAGAAQLQQALGPVPKQLRSIQGNDEDYSAMRAREN